MGIYTRFIDHLESRFRGPLPGPRAQYAMAHLARLREIAPPAHAKIAAVLALFYPKDGEWRIVFIERQSHNPRDQHRGQISFPGGRHDESDGSLRATALREAEEEVGVDAGKVAVVGQLTELYIPVSKKR
jgi:8-oxo-dGTP pyrophosphatase MutT (NUDIX family)